MSKDLNKAVLIDFYGDMLTDKQRDVLELYYDEDLSLSEIAEHERISRQGVHDSIKRGQQTLDELESKLKIAEKILAMQEILKSMNFEADGIYKESTMYNYPRSISGSADKILSYIKEIEKLFE